MAMRSTAFGPVSFNGAARAANWRVSRRSAHVSIREEVRKRKFVVALLWCLWSAAATAENVYTDCTATRKVLVTRRLLGKAGRP